jgi:hypothetical protein
MINTSDGVSSTYAGPYSYQPYTSPTTDSSSSAPAEQPDVVALSDEAMMHMSSMGSTPNPALPTTAGRFFSPANALDRGFNDGMLPAGLLRVGGGLAAVGGGIQAGNGINELRHGQVGKGTSDVATGGSNIAGGALLAAGSPLAPVAFGVASGIGGTEQLVSGIQHGKVGDAVEGGIKDVGAGLLIGGAVTGNPFAVAAGGLIEGGAAIWDNRKAIGHFVGKVGKDIGHAAADVGHAVGHAASDVGHAVGGAAKAVGHFLGL